MADNQLHFHDETTAVLGGNHTYESIDAKIASHMLTTKFTKGWLLGFAVTFGVLNMMVVSIAWLVIRGVGIWGINIPVAWGFDIINFVWWIGIGHAGTLISAILLLFRQQWRTSINRFAEAMTLFAVACAGIYPALHTGRPWLDYWLFPIPNVMNIWPQFRSPLMWDVFAVSTYASVSAVFWFIGLVPDFASLRDRAKNWHAKVLFGMLSLGWRGSAVHWHRYEMAYLLLAGLATPLVLSVHSIVSFDFAVSVIPGWHTTVFPPYFVAGAIYAGFAMVLTLMIPLRHVFGLKDMITLHHIDNMAKVMLATGLIVAYGYAMEGFTAWYSGNIYEKFALLENRNFGPYKFLYWGLILTNVVIPQLLWKTSIRKNIPVLFMLAMSVNVGMWLERFVIIVQSLHRDFLPSSWGMFYPTVWDWSLFIGTIGFFLCMIFLFVRFVPMIATAEMKHLLWHSKHEGEGHA